MKISRHTILIQDLPIHYEEVVAEGEPLVLIHGLAESSRVWYKNIAALAEHHHIYLVDLPGFGAMRHLGRHFNLLECAAWLDSWMQAVGLTSVHLVGHSMGGYVAMALAALRPEKIRRLVLVDSIGAPFEPGSTLRRVRYRALKAIGRTPAGFWPYIAYDSLRAGSATILKAAQQILALDAAEVMKSVLAPTLLVWGADDDLIPVAMSRPLHMGVAGSRLLILPHANHFCMFEQPRAFNDAVARFLQGQEVGVASVAASYGEPGNVDPREDLLMFHNVARQQSGVLPLAESQRLSTEKAVSAADSAVRHTHIAVLGTGFSGLGMAIRLKQQGYNDFVVLEKATAIGGTWRDNTYPGCACDIPSQLYSFSFAPNPNWSHMYPSQPEIRDYLRHCADRFGILPHVLWNSAVTNAAWHDDDQRWHITTSQQKLTADIFISGNGPLSEPSFPAIAGIESFEGTLFHSSRWPQDCDLTGKRVAVVGTGASAIQFVPKIQPSVAQLLLFLRTPPWIVPRLDRQIEASEQAKFRRFPILQRIKRLRIYLRNEITALGLIYRRDMMKTGIRFAQHHLERQVPDPVLRAKLTPHYAMGCKRILVSNDFYPALSRPNVEVITDHIREVRAHSIVTADGQEHEIDVLICGTGFHVTDTRLPQSIHGHNGQSLAEAWHKHPSAYLGTTVTGFPNLFLMIGPNTGLGHNSMVYMIESQFAYILDALHFMERRHIQAVEVRAEAQETFKAEMQRRMRGTAWTSGCSSWYLDSSGHNTTLWPGFTFEYRHRTRYFDAASYLCSVPQLAVTTDPSTSAAVG